MPWIKLYTEMLDDSKMRRLPERVKWRFVELLLIAGEADAEGALVDGERTLTIEDLAWRLRLPSDDLWDDLETLKKAGLIADNNGGWVVVSFAKRQGRSQSKKRAAWREQKRRQRARKAAKEAGEAVIDEGKPVNAGQAEGAYTGPEDRRADSMDDSLEVLILEGEVDEDEDKENEREIEVEVEGERRESSPQVTPKAAPGQEGESGPAPAETTELEEARDNLQKKLPPDDPIVVYQRATELTPNYAQRVEILNQVMDAQVWLDTLKHWLSHGWNPRNIAGMLELYGRGGPAGCRYCGEESGEYPSESPYRESEEG